MGNSNRPPAEYVPVRIIVDADGERVEPLDGSSPGLSNAGVAQEEPRPQPRYRHSLSARRPPQAKPIRRPPPGLASRNVSGLDWRRLATALLVIAQALAATCWSVAQGLAATSGWITRTTVDGALRLGTAALARAARIAAAAGPPIRRCGQALLAAALHLLAWIRMAGDALWATVSRLSRAVLEFLRRQLPVAKALSKQAMVAAWTALILGARAGQRLSSLTAARCVTTARDAWDGFKGGEPLDEEALSIYRHRPAYARQGVAERPTILVPLLASLGVVLLAIVVYKTTWPTLFAGFELLDAPTLTDRTLDEAVEAARAQGLDIAVASAEPTDDVPKDVVIEQTPAPGADIRRGSAVKLTVSAGLRAPNVVGKPLDEARSLLVRQGWTVAPFVDTRVANDSPPDTVVEQDPAPEELATHKGAVRLTAGVRNLAFGKRVQTSAGIPAQEAVDGNVQTVGTIPGGTPNWLEVDFGAPVAIAEIHLLTAQDSPGPSVVEVWGWDGRNRFSALHMFRQETSDNVTLSAQFGQPANVVRLRVATVSAPVPIGWREIRVLDR